MKRLSKSANRKKARQLRALRRSRQLKASWVAYKLGIGAGYLSALEQGKRRWTDKMIDSYLNVLGWPDGRIK
jgi:transcriptional regulator with XRE-family HTH domain